MRDQTGQTLILMLIVTVVSLTVGVAISSRAVSTLKQTSYTAQAGRAQKFADAGVEEALGAADLSAEVGTHTIDLDGGGDDVTYTVAESGNAESVEFQLEKDETYQLDLTSAGLTGLEIRWNKTGTNKDAIIVCSVIKKDGATGEVSLVQKGVSDPTESGADGCNLPLGSSNPTVSVGDSGYEHRITISGLSVVPAAGDELYIRVRVLCQDGVDTKVTALPAGTDLPNQGYTITSTGTYGEAEWTAEVTKMNPALPAIFDFVIFSNTDLTK